MPPMKLALETVHKGSFVGLNRNAAIKSFFSNRQKNNLLKKPSSGFSRSPVKANPPKEKDYSYNESDFFIDLLVCNICSLEGPEQQATSSTTSIKGLKSAAPLREKAKWTIESEKQKKAFAVKSAKIVSKFLLGDTDEYEISIIQVAVAGEEVGGITLKKNGIVLEGIDQEFANKLGDALEKEKVKLEKIGFNNWKRLINKLPISLSDVSNKDANQPNSSTTTYTEDTVKRFSDDQALLSQSSAQSSSNSAALVNLSKIQDTSSNSSDDDASGLDDGNQSSADLLRVGAASAPEVLNVEDDERGQKSSAKDADVATTSPDSTLRNSSPAILSAEGPMASGEKSSVDAIMDRIRQRVMANSANGGIEKVALITKSPEVKAMIERIMNTLQSKKKASPEEAGGIYNNLDLTEGTKSPVGEEGFGDSVPQVDAQNVQSDDGKFSPILALRSSSSATPLRQAIDTAVTSEPSTQGVNLELSLEDQYYEVVEEMVVPNSATTLLCHQEDDASSVVSDGGLDQVEEDVVSVFTDNGNTQVSNADFESSVAYPQNPPMTVATATRAYNYQAAGQHLTKELIISAATNENYAADWNRITS